MKLARLLEAGILLLTFFDLASTTPPGDWKSPQREAQSQSALTALTKLSAADGAANDWFGYSVSISGDYAIVGAQRNDDGGDESGAVYIFERDGSNWLQQAKLIPADGAPDDWFGFSVSIAGDYAIVGVYYDDDLGSSSGSAYIFKREGEVWVQQAKLTAADGAAYDFFGWSVSISGETAIIGARGDDDSGTVVPYGSYSGSAYIFRREGDTWIQQAKLLPADGATQDEFGSAVSISGSYALIGARGDDDRGEKSGSAYIFQLDGNSWIQQDKLTAADGAEDDQFGSAVSISGDYALAGVSRQDAKGNSSGAAYVFKRQGTRWEQQTRLIGSDTQKGDFFGAAVSITDETALIGAYYDDPNGSAYIFRRVGERWIQTEKLTPVNGDWGDLFGLSVSAFANFAIIGAFGDDENGVESGAVYVYNIPPTYSIYLPVIRHTAASGKRR